MARKLVVEIVGDASSLDRAFKKSSASANKFNSDMGKVTRGTVAGSGAFRTLGRSVAFASGGFLAGVGVTATIKSSISAASDLEQQISKTNVVFGESAKGVEDWSKTLATSFGLSQREALTTASTLGALLAPIGLTGTEAAAQSERLTQLGADLASFYNTDVQSAIDAVRSGLVGEAEPLRKYGVLLSETRVQQEALHQTGKKTASQLTDQEKVLARISILYKDSAVAQGDFGRTAETAANQLKIFNAQMENFKASVGQGVLPTLTRLVTFLNKMGPALNHAARLWRIFFFSLVSLALRAFLLIVEPFSHLPGRLGGWARDAKEAVQGELAQMTAFIAEQSANLRSVVPAAKSVGDALRAVRRRVGQIGAAGGGGPSGTDPNETKKEREARLARIRQSHEATRELAQERAAFAVERAAATLTLSDDLAALEKYNALLTRRIKGGHKTLALEREQFGVQQQIADLLKQQSEARKAARSARQFRLLGFGPTGEDLVPGVKALRRQLESVRDVVAGSFLDTRKTRGLLGHIRQVLSGGLGSVSSEVRAKIQQILADLKGQLKQSSVDVTRFQKTARGQLTLAGAHPTGGVVITGPVHFHGVQNVKQMEEALAKRRRQRANARRSTR